jgi:hypothetical protein
MNLPACYRIGIGTLAALAACALLGSVPAKAAAKSCEQDDDCPDKFTCEVTGTIECSDAKPCPEGEKCETPVSCEPEDYRECVSPSCEDDGDCPSDMVCYEQACVPRYVPPCSEDADCGDGFKCEEESISMCSGGGSTGSGTGTGGAASSIDGGQANPPDSETHCTTTHTGEFHCVLQPIACEDESDCPDGFSCEDDPNQATCVDTGAASGKGADDSAGSSDESRCPDASSSQTKSCLPPYSDLKGVDRGEQAGSTDGGHGTTENPPVTPSSSKKKSSGCSAAPAESHVTTAPLALLGLLCFVLGIRSTRRLALRRVRTGRRA